MLSNVSYTLANYLKLQIIPRLPLLLGLFISFYHFINVKKDRGFPDVHKNGSELS
jgi:hypothetical protein